MASIKENECIPLTWLEFIKDDGEPLRELYLWSHDAEEVRDKDSIKIEGDEYPDKTWLLNMIATYSMWFFASDAILKSRLRKRYLHYTMKDVDEIMVVPKLMRSLIMADRARRRVYPYKSVTPEEIEWAGDRASICSKVSAELIQMKADLAGGKSLSPAYVDTRTAWPIVQNSNDEKRRRWFQTSDDGCWENDLGEKWDEDDHGGMRPYDECGDTDEEDPMDCEEEPKRYLVAGKPPK